MKTEVSQNDCAGELMPEQLEALDALYAEFVEDDQLEAVIEAIRTQAIANATAIDRDWENA